MKKLLVIACALAMLGGKCDAKGPKPPHVQAAEAAEQAYFEADVASRLEVESAVEIQEHDGAARVVFSHAAEGTRARVTFDGVEYDFVVAEDGEVSE